MKSRVIFLCNAFDENTRRKRSIETDSPAGSRKVFFMAKALKEGNVRPYILSFGRVNLHLSFDGIKGKLK